MDYKTFNKGCLEEAKRLYKTANADQRYVLEKLFPELRETEDEKIRKWIINEIKIKHHNLDEENVDFADKAIAWLEKQEGCEHIRKEWLEHIKQSWYKEGFIDGKYSGGTSKEWTINDAAIFKEIIDFLENGTAKLQHDLTKYANWLKIQFTPIEKQGSNLIENGYTNNKDIIKYADNYSHAIWHKLMDNFKNIKDYCIGCNDVSDIVLNAIIDAYNWLEKQAQKPADKVEPKFKKE